MSNSTATETETYTLVTAAHNTLGFFESMGIHPGLDYAGVYERGERKVPVVYLALTHYPDAETAHGVAVSVLTAYALTHGVGTPNDVQAARIAADVERGVVLDREDGSHRKYAWL